MLFNELNNLILMTQWIFMRKIDMNHQMTVEEIKAEILRRFNDKVRNKKPDIAKEVNARHDGKQGHWLEQQMGLKANRSNDPDMYGFEMKNHTRGKTTFGDWSADYYIFKDANYGISRDSFLQIFGKPNQDKKGRCSWSGEPAPKIQGFNSFGQRLVIDNENNILAVYCFSQDQRPHKRQVVPPNLQKENLILAQWHYQSIKTKLENKFNQLGWFKCTQNAEGIYDGLVFGRPINFDNWLACVKTGEVFFDSGMYQGNSRNYSQWRANNTFWDSLIISRH